MAELDPTSIEIGSLGASLRGVLAELGAINAKLDRQASTNESMRDTIRDVDHHERNVRTMVGTIGERLEQIDRAHDAKLNALAENLTGHDDRLKAIEKWQAEMVARLGLLGGLAIMVGAVVGFAVKYLGPLLDWMEGKHDH